MKLHLDKVGYRVGDHQLLDDVSLHLEPDSRTVVLGANGAGKSTLVRLASGAITASEGGVSIDGRKMSSLTLRERSRKVAVLTQNPVLDFPFSVAEVVAMGRIPHGADKVRNTAVVNELLSLFALDGERIFTTLSGGERQLVQIARVLAQVWDQGSDALLILDEPTAPLDLRHQALLLDVLAAKSDAGLGQLLVMHDVNLAARYASQIVLLHRGQVLAAGPPRDVLEPETLKAAFGVAMRKVTDGTNDGFLVTIA